MQSINSAVRTISKEELAKKIEKSEPIQIINVLDPKYYNLGFIKGSKKIPLDRLNNRLGEIDKSKEVVTYGASYDCTASHVSAEILAAQGYLVSIYKGGIKEWRMSGLPID